MVTGDPLGGPFVLSRKGLASERETTERFPVQQIALPLDAPAVPRDQAVSPDHAVTGNDDRKYVGGASLTDRARFLRRSDSRCNVAIGDGRPGGNIAECGPHAKLEVGPAHVDGKIGFLLENARSGLRLGRGARPSGPRPRRRSLPDSVLEDPGSVANARPRSRTRPSPALAPTLRLRTVRDCLLQSYSELSRSRSPPYIQTICRGQDIRTCARPCAPFLAFDFGFQFLADCVKSLRVVEDNAERVTLAAAHFAHPMPEIDAIRATSPLHRTMMHSEDHRIALAKRHNRSPRLHAWPLLGENKLAAGEV
jgi:hypothetical protein